MTPTEELRRLRAENATLRQAQTTVLALVATLEADLSTVREQIAQLQTEVVRLQEEQAPKKGPPAFVKRTTPPTAQPGEPRKKRAAAHNPARLRAEPMQIMYHVLERCPDCAYQLRGGHEVWRRQIIELPEPVPVEVIEQRIMTRHCPACDRWHLPQVDFGGQVVGQGRLGVRLLSLLVYLRIMSHLPLRTMQRYLQTMHGLHLPPKIPSRKWSGDLLRGQRDGVA